MHKWKGGGGYESELLGALLFRASSRFRKPPRRSSISTPMYIIKGMTDQQTST